jgi:hypothetical protein
MNKQDIAEYFRNLVKKRNDKYGPEWRKENAKNAVKAREEKRQARGLPEQELRDMLKADGFE